MSERDLHAVRPPLEERRVGTPSARMAARAAAPGVGAFVDSVQHLLDVMGQALVAIAEHGCQHSAPGTDCLQAFGNDPRMWCAPCVAIAALQAIAEWDG